MPIVKRSTPTAASGLWRGQEPRRLDRSQATPGTGQSVAPRTGRTAPRLASPLL